MNVTWAKTDFNSQNLTLIVEYISLWIQFESSILFEAVDDLYLEVDICIIHAYGIYQEFQLWH